MIFALYPVSELLSFAVNQRGLAGFGATLGLLLFLSILPVSSRLALSSSANTVAAMGIGSALGAIACLFNSLIEVYLLNVGRAEAGLGNPSVLAAFALSLCCICICLLPVIQPKWRNLLVAGVFCSLGAIVLAGTRAVWLATPVAIFLAVLPLSKFKIRLDFRPGYILTGFIASAVALGGLGLVFSKMKATVESFQTGKMITSDASIADRLSLWSFGWEKAKASWLFGYGPDAMPSLMQEGQNHGELVNVYTHFHNFMLTGLLHGGVFELLALILVFAVLIWVSIQKSENQFQVAGRSILLSIVAATALPAMVGILFTHDIITAVFLFIVIISLNLASSQNKTKLG